jgi:hypothetical protein
LAALMGHALIFPSAKRTTPLSDMALSVVVRIRPVTLSITHNWTRPTGDGAERA